MKTERSDMKWRRKSGTFIALLSTLSPLRDDRGGLDGSQTDDDGDRSEPSGGGHTPTEGGSATAGSDAPAMMVRDVETATSVLIVDDIAMNRDIAGSILRKAGYVVSCAVGGVEAIAAVKTMAFDVVLMDVRMPEMDGLEATRQIRALEGGRGRVPIVALTSQAFPEHVEACRTAGMDGHVSKPFDPEMLVAAVARATPTGRAPEFLTVSIPVPAARGIGAELLIVDPEAFKRTASFLAPTALVSYLRDITALGKALLLMLDGLDAPEFSGKKLAEATHIVSGAAGMFGFERLTIMGRLFERATETGASGALSLAEALSAAIKATLPEIHSRTATAINA